MVVWLDSQHYERAGRIQAGPRLPNMASRPDQYSASLLKCHCHGCSNCNKSRNNPTPNDVNWFRSTGNRCAGDIRRKNWENHRCPYCNGCWGRRVLANGKDSWRPKPGHHSGHSFPRGSRSGPARDLSREELDGLREEARLAKQSNFPGRERGPFVKPGEKPGFWPGQALCANTAALRVGYSGSLFALYLWCLSNIAVCYMQVPLQPVSNSVSLFALYGGC